MATFRVTGKLMNGQPMKAVKVEASDALTAADPFARLVKEKGIAVNFDTLSYKRVHVKSQEIAFGDVPKPAAPAAAKPDQKKAGK